MEYYRRQSPAVARTSVRLAFGSKRGRAPATFAAKILEPPNRGCATHDRARLVSSAASHIIGRTDNAMTKIALTKAPTSLLECVVYILLDRGCAVSAMRNYLKLHMSRTLKVLLCYPHAKTRKLWKRSAGLPPLEAILVDQSTSRPLLYFMRPLRYPLHSPRFPCYADIARRLVLVSSLPSRAAPA